MSTKWKENVMTSVHQCPKKIAPGRKILEKMKYTSSSACIQFVLLISEFFEWRSSVTLRIFQFVLTSTSSYVWNWVRPVSDNWCVNSCVKRHETPRKNVNRRMCEIYCVCHHGPSSSNFHEHEHWTRTFSDCGVAHYRKLNRQHLRKRSVHRSIRVNVQIIFEQLYTCAANQFAKT